MEQLDWLTKLYCEHKQLLMLVAWNVVGHVDLAEDAVHAAIVALAQLTEPPNDPRLYAIRVVRNMAIDMARKRNRSREQSWDDQVGVFFDNKPEPDTNEHRLQILEAALITLDIDARETIRLHLQAGLSFREMADALEMPLQTIASRYQRAIKKLRAMVEVPYE